MKQFRVCGVIIMPFEFNTVAESDQEAAQLAMKSGVLNVGEEGYRLIFTVQPEELGSLDREVLREAAALERAKARRN